eukprot:13982455-Ditylum_brightwellii.AAC.1
MSENNEKYDKPPPDAWVNGPPRSLYPQNKGMHPPTNKKDSNTPNQTQQNGTNNYNNDEIKCLHLEHSK